MHCLDIKTLADRRFETNLTLLSRLIDGVIGSTELLTQINFEVPNFNACHMYLFPFIYMQHQLFKKLCWVCLVVGL